MVSEAHKVSLRHIDWRFLVPFPPEGVFRHLVLLGGPPGLDELVVESGVAQRVSRQVPKGELADAVVILHDAQVALNDVARCLLPGGVLYWEVERRWPSSWSSTPGQVRRSLQNLGLSSTGFYWVRPDFAECQMYLPLDIPGALKWYLMSSFVASTPARRLVEPGLRILAQLGCPFALLARCYVVTAVASPEGDTSPSLLAHPELPIELGQSGTRPFILAPGDDYSRATIFAFTPDGTQPTAVLKIPRHPDRNISVENEQAALAAIRTHLNGTMRDTVPRPLGTLRWGQLSVGIESCAPGRLLAASSARWMVPLRQKVNDLHLVTDWLVEFHSQAQIRRSQWGSQEVCVWVETPLAAYEHEFGVTVEEERLFAEARACASSLVGTPVPTVWVHGGLSQHNLFRHDHKITAIDWEGGSAGPPLLDLLYFVSHWSFTVRSLYGDAAHRRGFAELFCGRERTDPISVAVHQAIAHYMARLDIDRRFLPLLLVVTSVVRCLGRANRQEWLGTRREDARADNHYLKFVSVLAEHADQLFAETNGRG